MLRLTSRLSVYRKNEETNAREIDYPHDAHFAEAIKEEVMRVLDNTYFVDDDGNVYVIGVRNIEVEV